MTRRGERFQVAVTLASLSLRGRVSRKLLDMAIKAAQRSEITNQEWLKARLYLGGAPLSVNPGRASNENPEEGLVLSDAGDRGVRRETVND